MSTETAAAPDANAIVTSTDDSGRTLSGVGASAEHLAEVMERHAPEETPAPAESAAPPEPAKPSRGRARFSELAHQRDEAKQRADTLERELTELRAKSSTAPASSPPAPAPTSTSVPNVGDSGRSTRPQPSEDEVGTKYKTYADFVLDSARWVVEQQQSDFDARIQQRIEGDRATRDFLSHAESTWAKGRKVYPDFDTVRMTGPGAHVPMDAEKIRTILHHPATEHMQYVIAKDAALAQQLAQMGPIDFGMAMASFAPAGPAAPLASTGANGSTTPPAPMQPVGSGSPTTAPSSADLAHKGDYHAYKARREAERKARR
jgi:hypothetical protein